MLEALDTYLDTPPNVPDYGSLLEKAYDKITIDYNSIVTKFHFFLKEFFNYTPLPTDYYKFCRIQNIVINLIIPEDRYTGVFNHSVVVSIDRMSSLLIAIMDYHKLIISYDQFIKSRNKRKRSNTSPHLSNENPAKWIKIR